MERRIRFTLIVFLVVQPLIGCTSWRVQGEPAQEVVRLQKPGAVRLRMADGRDITLERPRVAGDSLAGKERENWPIFRKLAPTRRVAVPLNAVEQVRVKKLSTAKTTAFILVIGAEVALIVFARALEKSFANPWPAIGDQP